MSSGWGDVRQTGFGSDQSAHRGTGCVLVGLTRLKVRRQQRNGRGETDGEERWPPDRGGPWAFVLVPAVVEGTEEGF